MAYEQLVGSIIHKNIVLGLTHYTFKSAVKWLALNCKWTYNMEVRTFCKYM